MAEPGRISQAAVNPGAITPEMERAFNRASAMMRRPAVDLGRGLDNAIRRAERLTNENNHTEALRTLTDHFGYETLSDELAEIRAEHSRARSLSPELYERRNQVMDELFNRVRREYGTDIFNRIHRAL